MLGIFEQIKFPVLFGKEIKNRATHWMGSTLTTSIGICCPLKTSLSVCQVARATGEAKCHGSKLHKEVREIKVYWFVCLNTFKFAKSKNELFET